MRTMRACMLLAAAGSSATPAAAQVPGIDLQLVPKVGFYAPAADLQAASDAAGEIVDERGGSLALGLALDFGVPLAPVGFRAGFDYVTSSEFTYADRNANLEATAEQTMLALAGDVVFRPLPRLIIVQPYLLAGAGVKRYDFSFSEQAGDTDIETAFPESQTDFSVHAGLGIDLGIGPLALVTELSDYVSWYEAEGSEESEMQHDLFIMAGVRVGLF